MLDFILKRTETMRKCIGEYFRVSCGVVAGTFVCLFRLLLDVVARKTPPEASGNPPGDDHLRPELGLQEEVGHEAAVPSGGVALQFSFSMNFSFSRRSPHSHAEDGGLHPREDQAGHSHRGGGGQSDRAARDPTTTLAPGKEQTEAA